MHRVLQQEWVNGNSYLVEKEQLETWKDILDLSSEPVGDLKEEDPVISYEEDGDSEDLEEISEKLLDELPGNSSEKEMVEVEILSEESPQGMELEGDQADEAIVQELEEPQELYKAETDSNEGAEVITWYYWPNGSLVKGY